MTKTARIAPPNVATRYNHKCSKLPETTAGASERAGFIEALVTGPANNASSPTTVPMATPAIRPFSLAPNATCMITNISIKVRISSITRALSALTVGMVAPSVSWLGNSHANSSDALNAPATWLMM